MLKGDKVVLRAVTVEDLPRLCAFHNDLELHALADDEPWRPRSLAQMQAMYDDLQKKTDELAWFSIDADGELIGDCSLYSFEFTGRTCTLGILIGDHDYLGKGYGTDAVRLLLDYAFRYRNLRRVWLTTLAHNERAIRSYEKAGFVREGLLRQHGWSDGAYRDIVQMGILRDAGPIAG